MKRKKRVTMFQRGLESLSERKYQGAKISIEDQEEELKISRERRRRCNGSPEGRKNTVEMGKRLMGKQEDVKNKERKRRQDENDPKDER
jgi:hypothetical protein